MNKQNNYQNHKQMIWSILGTLFFAVLALYLINPFYYFLADIFSLKPLTQMDMKNIFIWTLKDHIPYYLLDFLIAFSMRIIFLRINLSLPKLPIIAYIIFSTLLRGMLLSKIYFYNYSSAQKGLVLGECFSIIVSMISAYLGWKLSMIIFMRRNCKEII